MYVFNVRPVQVTSFNDLSDDSGEVILFKLYYSQYFSYFYTCLQVASFNDLSDDSGEVLLLKLYYSQYFSIVVATAD